MMFLSKWSSARANAAGMHHAFVYGLFGLMDSPLSPYSPYTSIPALARV